MVADDAPSRRMARARSEAGVGAALCRDDRAGSRTFHERPLATCRDEHYGHDDLHRSHNKANEIETIDGGESVGSL